MFCKIRTILGDMDIFIESIDKHGIDISKESTWGTSKASLPWSYILGIKIKGRWIQGVEDVKATLEGMII